MTPEEVHQRFQAIKAKVDQKVARGELRPLRVVSTKGKWRADERLLRPEARGMSGYREP